MSQANTKEGQFSAIAAEDLWPVADIILCACNFENALGVRRPTNNTHIPLYVLIYGAEKGFRATVLPLNPNRSVRVVAKGCGLPGDLLRNTVDGTGRVMTILTPTEGRDVGVAEEAFADGQLVKMRPL